MAVTLTNCSIRNHVTSPITIVGFEPGTATPVQVNIPEGPTGGVPIDIPDVRFAAILINGGGYNTLADLAADGITCSFTQVAGGIDLNIPDTHVAHFT